MPNESLTVGEIADEIRTFGQSMWRHQVQVDHTGRVIAGQKVVQACRVLGMRSVTAELVLG
jgi:hypothetical protein